MAGSIAPNTVTDGLVLALDAANKKSYLGSGTAWTDLSSNGNNGTLVNSPLYNGESNGNLAFDGVNTYVSVPAITPSRITLSCWFKPTGVSTNDDSYGGILIVSNSQYYLGGVQFAMNYSWAYQRSGVTIKNVQCVAPVNSILHNSLTNVVGVYDGTTIKIYINGVLRNTTNHSIDPVYPTTGDTTVKIGKWGYAQYTRQFNGNIYQALIYDKPLSSQEILQNYNATKLRFI